MSQIIDTQGLTCPAPVLLVKDAIERKMMSELTVLVDNEPSRENVTRFLQSQKYTVSETQENQLYRLQARRSENAPAPVQETTAEGTDEGAAKKIVVLIATDQLGAGDETLGRKLIVSYLKTLKEMGSDLWQLIFLNGGVKLTTSSSPVLTEIREYEQAGVIVLACGTCLEHFQLTEKKAVGQTTNMLDIVTATQLADKVITIC